MYSSHTATTANYRIRYSNGTVDNYDEAGYPRPREYSRKEERARRRGCKTCANRFKGLCHFRKFAGLKPFITSAFGNDPSKVKCRCWCLRGTHTFEIPVDHKPLRTRKTVQGDSRLTTCDHD